MARVVLLHSLQPILAVRAVLCTKLEITQALGSNHQQMATCHVQPFFTRSITSFAKSGQVR